MSENAPIRVVLNLLLPFIFITGIVLIPVGIGLRSTDTSVTHVEEYSECQGTDFKKACIGKVVTRDLERYTECDCLWSFSLNQDIIGNVTLYYVTEFDWSDATYASLRDEGQLRGEPGAVPAECCGNVPAFPYGELANSIFNDTFSSLKSEHKREPYIVANIELSERVATTTFRNIPQGDGYVSYAQVSVPVYRVVDPRLPNGLPAGNYSIGIHIHNPLPKNGFKKFVLKGESARAQAGYVLAGAIALVAGVGAVLLSVLLYGIAVTRGYVTNPGTVLRRVLKNIRNSRVVRGSAELLKTVAGRVLALYSSFANNRTSFLRKVKRVLPYKTVIIIAGSGLVLMSIGFFAAIYTTEKTSHIEDYSACHGADVERACVAERSRNYTECVCLWRFVLTQPLAGAVTLYYETEYNQTGATYASSKDESQLRGEPGAAPAPSCGDFRYDGGRPIYPCGELADSMFNDSFSSLVFDDESRPIVLSYTDLGLVEDTAYHNPPEDVWDQFVKPKSWLFKKYNTWDSGSRLTGVENEAFRAWMDTSIKRKPVARVVAAGLPAGNYTIRILIHSPLAKYGSKKLVLEGVQVRARPELEAAGAAALLAGLGVLLYGVLLHC